MSEETQEMKKWCLEIAAQTVGRPHLDSARNESLVTTADAIVFAQEMYKFLTEE